jgi:ribosomal-protein-alanine N-acetyltransferase
MTGIRIERAGAAEAERMAELHARCFAQCWDAAAFARLMAREGSLAFLASPLAGPAPQSLILVQLAGDEAEILTVGTIPAARRTGLARALLNATANEAHECGARAMFLEVAEDNIAARCLYHALGFRMAGKRRGYYREMSGKLTDALILRAALPLAAR